MKRKRTSRRPKAKAAKPKKVVVGLEMDQPSRAQLSALRKVFTPKTLASVGLGPRAISTIRTPLRKPTRRG
jgi:hypothetical protein